MKKEGDFLMCDWTCKMIDRVFAVIFAILFMQFPLFMEQYTIRLSGHVKELAYQVKEIEKVAHESGKSLDQFIQKFIDSNDIDFSKQGGLMEAMVIRMDRLSDSLAAILNANVFTRPFIFLWNSEWDIVQATAKSYKLGISITLESVVYAFIGVVIGYYIYQLTSVISARISEGFRRARRKEESSDKK